MAKTLTITSTFTTNSKHVSVKIYFKDVDDNGKILREITIYEPVTNLIALVDSKYPNFCSVTHNLDKFSPIPVNPAIADINIDGVTSFADAKAVADAIGTIIQL